ncbi:MAG: hypothetical protein ACOX3T_00545 [Bdellovibrionota bacterium]
MCGFKKYLMKRVLFYNIYFYNIYSISIYNIAILLFKLLSAILLLSIITLSFALDAHSEEQSRAFFTQGSAKSIFLPEAKVTEKQDLQYFKEKKEIKKDSSKTSRDEELIAETKNESLENNSLVKNEEKELTPSGKILAKYGNPEEDLTYYPENNAPAPFKGIMAALQIGDEDLAFRYAKQYINYTAKESDLVGKTIAFQKLALEGTGRAEEGRFSNDSDVVQYKYLLEKEKELKEKKEREERERKLTKAIKLSKSDKTLFDSFDDSYKVQIQRSNKEAKSYYDTLEAKKQEKIAKGELVEEKESVEEKSEKLIERAAIRNEYQGRVPVDPAGEVSIYFFFKPNEKASINLGIHVEELYKSIIKDQNVHLVGVNVDGLSLNAFKRITKANFPVLNGDRLVRLMGIETFPSIYFRCETSGEAFVFNKAARKYELREILSLMRGEK